VERTLIEAPSPSPELLKHLAGCSTATRRGILLHYMTRDQRVAHFLTHPHDAERVRKAMAKRQRKAGLAAP